MKLRKVFCKHIPRKGFMAIVILIWMVIREEYRDKLPWWADIHENIHLQQEIEMLFVIFYLWYGIEFLLKLVVTWDSKMAYDSVSFEQEAYKNQLERAYLERRRHYAWLKYVFKLKSE